MDIILGEIITINHIEDEVVKILKGKVIQLNKDSLVLEIKFKPFKKKWRIKNDNKRYDFRRYFKRKARSSRNTYVVWNALSWMPIITDGIFRRCLYGSWIRSRRCFK